MLKQNGFILMFCLGILTLISLLIFHYMQNIALYYQAYTQMINAAQTLNTLTKQSEIFITHYITTHEPIQNSQIIFTLEDLGRYPCVVYQTIDGLFTTHHWQLHAQSKGSNREINIRFFTKDAHEICINQPLTIVTQPVLSWQLV